MARKDEIIKIAESVTRSHGVELYWVKYQNVRSAQVVQIMIDKPGGVSHTDCVTVSRALEELLDEKIDHNYELEVSSPGVERPLFVPEHYNGAIGEEIKVKTYAPIDGSKVWEGTLERVSPTHIELMTKNGLREIVIEQIAQAHVSPQFDYS